MELFFMIRFPKRGSPAPPGTFHEGPSKNAKMGMPISVYVTFEEGHEFGERHLGFQNAVSKNL